MVCPPGWVENGNRCYLIDVQARTQSQADALCTQKNGNIVEIESAEENTFLSGQLGNGRNAWLACSDATTEGTWVCPSGANHMWVAGTGGGNTISGYFSKYKAAITRLLYLKHLHPLYHTCTTHVKDLRKYSTEGVLISDG